MLGIPGQNLLSLTPAAVSQLRRTAGGGCVRIGVKRGGCAGMEYTMERVGAPAEHDEVVEQDGVRLAVAPMATLHLVGTEIDYRSGVLESGFSFHNPNVVESCGCGESVKFAETAAEGEASGSAAG